MGDRHGSGTGSQGTDRPRVPQGPDLRRDEPAVGVGGPAGTSTSGSVEHLLEYISDAFFALDPSWRFTFVNHQAETYFGCAREELVGRSIWEVLPPDLRDLVFEKLQRARDDHLRTDVDLTQRSTRRTFAARIYPSDGAVCVYFREDTERRAHEDAERLLGEAGCALASSLEVEGVIRRLPRLVVPALADSCAIILRDGGPAEQVAEAHVDPEGEALLRSLRRMRAATSGAGVARVLETGVAELVPEIGEAWEREAAVSEEHHRIIEALHIRSAMILPLRAHGRVLGVLSCSTTGRRTLGEVDFDAGKRLADIAALALSNSMLYRDSRSATRLRDDVLGVVSHDLRSPLAVISVSTERLLRAAAREGRERDLNSLQAILRAARRANRLVEDLLDVARLQSKKIIVAPAEADPAALVADAAETARESARAKGLILEVDVDEGLPKVLADPDRLPQVFSNLIGNAIKFTPPGGVVRVGAHQLGDYVRFTVRDTGPGIVEEDLGRVFDPFWQASDAGSGSGGSGLGLAIVKGIVTAHGGRVEAHSLRGKGATFAFTLPSESLVRWSEERAGKDQLRHGEVDHEAGDVYECGDEGGRGAGGIEAEPPEQER